MPLPLLPNVERAVSLLLRAHPDFAGLVGDDEYGVRVFTAVPREVGAEPFLIVRRFGGAPTLPRPLVHETASLQLDAFGGRMVDAERWARTAAAVLADLAGPLDDGTRTGWVTGVNVGALRNLPDETFEPARPRYVLDVDVFVKRARSDAPSGASRSSRTRSAVTAR